MLQVLHLPPLSLYVHIPWCVRKCPYCDFNSHAFKGNIDSDAYVSAVLRDLAQEIDLVGDRAINSIFIGGGTPSLLPSSSIKTLLDGVQAFASLAHECEITLEANPGAVDTSWFQGYRAAGVNRLSIGVQSFATDKLIALGRVHDAQEALSAVAAARAAGFDNINLDMMFGLPEQTVAQGLDDLTAGLALKTTHYSWYQLTLEPNTRFYNDPPPLPAHDDLVELQEAGQELLANEGFQQYEVSAYAAPGRRCRHNENYWQFGDYIGIGAGAHGKLTLPEGRVVRRWRVRHPVDYLRRVGTPQVLAGQREIRSSELGVEFLMNVLRLREGVPDYLFIDRTGHELSTIRLGLDEARRRGMLESDRLRATEFGWRFLDDLVAIFEPL